LSLMFSSLSFSYSILRRSTSTSTGDPKYFLTYLRLRSSAVTQLHWGACLVPHKVLRGLVWVDRWRRLSQGTYGTLPSWNRWSIVNWKMQIYLETHPNQTKIY
jgi:hypothetical protein